VWEVEVVGAEEVGVGGDCEVDVVEGEIRGCI